MALKLKQLLALVVVGFPIQTCMPQQPPTQPIKVYLLGVDSDLKGDFAQLGPELTAALQAAFSSQAGAFTLLDRTNLDQLVKGNQLEDDLGAVLHGAAPSSRLAQIADTDIPHADGFIRSELRDGADGAVLSVALVKLNSEIPWSHQIIFTPAKWLSNDIQKSAATILAGDAAQTLVPRREASSSSVASAAAGRAKADLAADDRLTNLTVARTGKPRMTPPVPHGATVSRATATNLAQKALETATADESCLRSSYANTCALDSKAPSLREELENNGIEVANLDDAIRRMESKPTGGNVKHCAGVLRVVALNLQDIARRAHDESPEVVQQPGAGQFIADSYRMDVGEVQGQETHGKTIYLPVTVESLSNNHFRFQVRWHSCYLADERGNTWTQDDPDSGAVYFDSVGMSEDGIEMVPGVPVRSLFHFSAKGDASGTVFAFVCFEDSPTNGRQIIIRGIKSH